MLSSRFKQFAIVTAIAFLVIILCAHFLLSDDYLYSHTFEPSWLLPSLNMIFLGISFLTVSCLSAESYLKIGSLSLLLFGSGALLFGLNGTLAGWFMKAPDGTNITITIFNSCSFLSGLSYFAGTVLILLERTNEKNYARRKRNVIWGYGAVFTLVALLIAASYYGWLPAFFSQDQGFSVLRQIVISSSIGLLMLSGLILLISYRDSRTEFIFWHALALILIAEGLLGVATARSVGGLIGWTGRLAQYLGGIYLMTAVISATRERSLDEVLAQLLTKPGTLYASVFENSLDGIVVADPGGPVLSANPQACRMLGYSEIELRRMAISDLMIMNDPHLRSILQARHPKNHYRGELTFICKDGTRFPADVSCSAFEDSRAKVLFNFLFRDISNRKKTEATMQYNMDRYGLLSSTGSELLHASEPQTIVHGLCLKVMHFLDCDVFFNYLVDPFDKRRLHLNAFAGIAHGEAQKIESLDFGVAVCGRVARNGLAIVAEHIPANQDISVQLVKQYGIRAYACHPLLSVDGKTIGTLSFGTRTREAFSAEDLSLMKTVTNLLAMAMVRMQKEKALRSSQAALAEANEELEQKVRSRTEELANTVEALSATNQQLNAYSAKLRSLAGEITMAEHRERKRLSIMLHDGIQQLLAAAKLQVGGLGNPADASQRRMAEEIEKLLSDAIQMSRTLSAELSPPVLHAGRLQDGLKWLSRWMLEKYRLKADLELEDIPPLVENLKILLFESVRELLFNAAKHSRVDRVHVSVRQAQSGELQITVADDGSGFDPAILQSTENANQSLGLFSIRERLELIGGRLSVESSPGKGSRFIITTPLMTVQNEQKKEHAPVDPIVSDKTQRNLRLLVADDHTVLRSALSRMLSSEEGIETVAEAQNGVEAVELAKAMKPDVILMDINMPKMDGIEATRIIHQVFPDIRIIGLSMYEEEERVQDIRAAGAVGYVLKSGAKEHLLAAIRSCRREIEESTAGRQPS